MTFRDKLTLFRVRELLGNLNALRLAGKPTAQMRREECAVGSRAGSGLGRNSPIPTPGCGVSGRFVYSA